MYRFAEYNVVNIQCDILICRGKLSALRLNCAVCRPI